MLCAIATASFQYWGAVALFEREAKVLANLDYPQIPKYLDYFYIDLESDRRFYLIQFS